METKVLVATTAPRGSGGLGAAAAELADGVAALGAEVSYLGPQPPTPAQKLAVSRPYRRLFGMAASRRLASRAVRRALPATGWDVLYATPECLPPEARAGTRVIHQATHLPTIEWEVLRRAERSTGGRADMSKAECRQRERELADADLIHVTSQTVRDEFLAAGFPPEKIVHSYLGVDLERYRPVVKGDGLRVAFIGPLSLRKGVDTAREVAERLRGEAVVEAVGGPACPWSRGVVADAPFAFGDSAAGTLARSQALILPSRSDGFSYVVLEALASGTVPIVTPAVGAAEVVRRLDPRLVVEQDQFADAAVELLCTLDLVDLGRRARTLAEEFDRRRTSYEMAKKILGRAKTKAE
jgi:glycosyltransferase involved in cell wall biosynthesis